MIYVWSMMDLWWIYRGPKFLESRKKCWLHGLHGLHGSVQTHAVDTVDLLQNMYRIWSPAWIVYDSYDCIALCVHCCVPCIVLMTQHLTRSNNIKLHHLHQTRAVFLIFLYISNIFLYHHVECFGGLTVAERGHHCNGHQCPGHSGPGDVLFRELLRTLIKIRWQGEDISIFHRWIVAFSMLRNIDGIGMMISTCNNLFLQVGPLSLSLWSSICVLPRFSLN